MSPGRSLRYLPTFLVPLKVERLDYLADAESVIKFVVSARVDHQMHMGELLTELVADLDVHVHRGGGVDLEAYEIVVLGPLALVQVFLNR